MNADNKNNEEWRDICKQVLQETKKEKVEMLLEELAQALDRRARERDSQAGPTGSKC